MGCRCKEHSRGGFKEAAITFEAVEKTRPLDQCIACTCKHIADAWQAFCEYTYEQVNRAHIIGQLQLAIHHSCKRWKNVADKARELSHLVQQGRNCGDKWENLVIEAQSEYEKEHPEQWSKPDIIIPLGNGSCVNNVVNNTCKPEG